MLCAGTGVPAARFPLRPWHSADRSRHTGALGPVPCCLSPRRNLLCPVPAHALGSAVFPCSCAVIRAGWQHLAVSLLCPQALRLVCPELLLLPQQGPGIRQAEEEAPRGY